LNRSWFHAKGGTSTGVTSRHHLKGRTGYGNRCLGNAAASAGPTDTFLGERYRITRRGGKKAVVATGRSMLVVIWHLIADPDARYGDLPAAFTRPASTPNAASATTSVS
jgi:hypothetical protein